MSSDLSLWEESDSVLDEFISEHLRPDDNVAETLDHTLDTLIHHITKRATYTISRIRRGSSLATRINLKDDDYEFELIIFISDLRGLDDYRQRIESILIETRDIVDSEDLLHLVMLKGDREKMIEDREITIRVLVEDEWFEGKVTPTVDLLGVKPSNGTLETMYRNYSSNSEKSLYSPALRELYIDIVQSVPQRVRDLILLLKHWVVSRLQLRGRKPPPKFWETLAIGRWTKAGSPKEFNYARGLYDILNCLGDWRTIMVTWEHCVFRTYPKKLAEEKRREVDYSGGDQVPVMFDPVDPHVNYTNGITPLIWEEIARTAIDSCSDKLFENVKQWKSW